MRVGQCKVFGVLQYDIQSSTPPSAASVPAIQAPNTGLGAVLDQIFGAGNYTIVGGGNYYFRYLNVAGVEYDQSSCTGTPHIPATANTPALLTEARQHGDRAARWVQYRAAGPADPRRGIPPGE